MKVKREETENRTRTRIRTQGEGDVIGEEMDIHDMRKMGKGD